MISTHRLASTVPEGQAHEEQQPGQSSGKDEAATEGSVPQASGNGKGNEGQQQVP